MSRTHIGPVEQHPGHPETIEGHADALARLAEQALRVEEITDRSFDTATAHWAGLGAAELLTAPASVKQRVATGSEALMWASTTLRYWANRVREFNRVVDSIENRWPDPTRLVVGGVALPVDGLLHSRTVDSSSDRNGGTPTRSTSSRASARWRPCSRTAPPWPTYG